MLALLVSGKFACLLGALLIFAPRLLFDAPHRRTARTPCRLAMPPLPISIWRAFS